MLPSFEWNPGSVAAMLLVALLVFLAVRRMVLDKKAGIGACGQKCANCAKMGQCGVEQAAVPSSGPPAPTACGGSCGQCKYSAVCHKGVKP